MEENLLEVVYYDDNNVQHIAYTTETEFNFIKDRYDKVEKNKKLWYNIDIEYIKSS